MRRLPGYSPDVSGGGIGRSSLCFTHTRALATVGGMTLPQLLELNLRTMLNWFAQLQGPEVSYRNGSLMPSLAVHLAWS